jgi:hypothetical protein
MQPDPRLGCFQGTGMSRRPVAPRFRWPRMRGRTAVSARVSVSRRRPTRGRANFPWYGVEQRGIELSDDVRAGRRRSSRNRPGSDDATRRQATRGFGFVQPRSDVAFG